MTDVLQSVVEGDEISVSEILNLHFILRRLEKEKGWFAKTKTIPQLLTNTSMVRISKHW